MATETRETKEATNNRGQPNNIIKSMTNWTSAAAKKPEPISFDTMKYRIDLKIRQHKPSPHEVQNQTKEN
jgi:hypothetical protein